LIESLKELLNQDIQFVFLGVGDKHYINRIKLLKEKFPEKVSVNEVFDGNLAKRIYASSDMFLMPSVFEPCGLSQLISFRYGTIPIARKTGGLNDTVIGFLGNKEKGNGFTFYNNNPEDLIEVINLALKEYNNKEEWKELQKRVMSLDYSWGKSAQEYLEVYKRII
jgi:starch synthase